MYAVANDTISLFYSREVNRNSVVFLDTCTSSTYLELLTVTSRLRTNVLPFAYGYS